MKTQYESVKEHLDNIGSITSFEAFDKYGITRLSQYIHVLRKEGVNIESKFETKKNRYGHSTTFVKYIKVPEQENTN